MITKVTDNKSLNEAIVFLEQKQQSDLYLLKEHFEFTKEQLNPVKIIKDEVKGAFTSPDLTGKVLKGAVSLLSGFLAKRFVVGAGGGVVSKLAGAALQTGVTTAVMNNVPEKLGTVKDSGISLLQKGLQKIKIK